MKFLASALASAVLCVSALPAHAQSRGAELTIFNGYYIASDLYTSVGTAAGAQIGMANSYMWGARIGVDPNPRTGVEFAYTRIGSDLEVRNSPVGYAPADVGRLNGNCYDLDFLFYQPTTNPRAKGYFTMGFGWTVTDPDIQAPSGKTIDSNSLFNWNFGIGAKVDVNEKVALRLEGRWRITDTAITTDSGLYCDYWGYCYSYASDWYDSGELTAGLTFKLGGSR
jgi:opacity protein-like surface antigen